MGTFDQVAAVAQVFSVRRDPKAIIKAIEFDRARATCTSCNGCFKPGLQEGGIYCVVDKKEQRDHRVESLMLPGLAPDIRDGILEIPEWGGQEISMQGKDARVWKRVGVFAPTLVQVVRRQRPPDVFQGIATDIGPGGMYIFSDELAECDELVTLDVDLVEFGAELTESGRVVRSDGSGFAVKFLYRCEMFDSVRQL